MFGVSTFILSVTLTENELFTLKEEDLKFNDNDLEIIHKEKDSEKLKRNISKIWN
uniref:Uncharacterized protein n=1 Tax=Rhizophagus irregularis (strain DAOM 181602 / DAOM 197198 / MUCL 43194) TaxID=747089 RepID=U9T3K5_RHIID